MNNKPELLQGLQRIAEQSNMEYIEDYQHAMDELSQQLNELPRYSTTLMPLTSIVAGPKKNLLRAIDKYLRENKIPRFCRCTGEYHVLTPHCPDGLRCISIIGDRYTEAVKYRLQNAPNLLRSTIAEVIRDSYERMFV